MSDKEVSVYTYLNRWLYDGSKTSPLPEEVRSSKDIGPQYILYYFKDSIYNLYMNEVFNNYDVYKLDKNECLKFLKKCVLATGFKPQFMPKQKETQTKIGKILKERYPYYKKDDINLLVSIIDNSDRKDQIYETLGLFSAKKTKTTAADKKEIVKLVDEKSKEVVKPKSENVVTKQSFLSGFEIER